MNIAIIIMYILLILYFVREKRINDGNRGAFLHVIHVNGIRGKTTVCRLLDACLRQKYRVFTKTTGTAPMTIGVLGEEQRIIRLGPANINEQIKIMGRAKKEGAQILILECMAVNPELQLISQNDIVKSDIAVITNVRHDHIYEMGGELEEIALALSGVVPLGGKLYTGEKELFKVIEKQCESKQCQAIFCPGDDNKWDDNENEAIARSIGKSLGLTDGEIDQGFSNIKKDVGTEKLYPIKNKNGENIFFLNLFSANDPDSTRLKTDRAKSGFSQICFIYNNRYDRPDRALLFGKHFFPHYPGAKIYLAGNNKSLAKRIFIKEGSSAMDIEMINNFDLCLTQDENTLLVGIGNIKGMGLKIIETLERMQ